jgi:hypothetical protein
MAKNFGIPDDSPILTGTKQDPVPEPEPGPDPDPELPLLNPRDMALIAATVAAVMKAVPSAPATSVAAVAAGVREAMAGNVEANAAAMKRVLKPENDPAPMVSVFNPAGDRDHPRPTLKCQFTLFDGVPIDGLTDTVEELTLYNRLVAGDYWVTKSDGTMVLFKVREHRNDLDELQRINLWFPCRDEADRNGCMPMVVWLREIVWQIDRVAA